jgi:hypothetical protein
MHVPTDREVLCLFPVTFMHSVAAATLDPKYLFINIHGDIICVVLSVINKLPFRKQVELQIPGGSRKRRHMTREVVTPPQ